MWTDPDRGVRFPSTSAWRVLWPHVLCKFCSWSRSGMTRLGNSVGPLFETFSTGGAWNVSRVAGAAAPPNQSFELLFGVIFSSRSRCSRFLPASIRSPSAPPCGSSVP